ncbi:MAG: hypothetical protein K5886_13255 [Lachnospiraceae bacterium]|nr:hypothetical protein [Lachnospiraceae bacterium]
MGYSEEKFREALEGKKIPTLVLDNKWHKLFKKMGTTDDIIRLEGELTNLLKRQGKINTDIKGLKKLKSDLMDGIVNNMGDSDDAAGKKAADLKIAENKRLIDEANEKIDAYGDELLELPKQIDEVNRSLMVKSMALCYEKLSANTDEIEEIADWIHNIRIELKKNIIRKQEKEYYNAELYSFMHDIFGPVVMDLFDMRYEPKLRTSGENNENDTDSRSDEGAGS